MATLIYHECLINGDMADAVNGILNEGAQNLAALQDQVKAIDLATPIAAMNVVQDQLNAMLLKTGNAAFANLQTLASNTGTPAFPTGNVTTDRLTSETRMGLLGLAVVNGATYLANSSGNITALRNLYFAVGRSLNEVQTVLSNTTHANVIIGTVEEVYVQSPTSSPPTLAYIQQQLNRQDISNTDVTFFSNFAIVRLKNFIGIDKNPTSLGLDLDDVYYSVFHYVTVSQTTANILNFKNVGLTGNFLTSALFNESIRTLDASSITSTTTQVTSGLTALNGPLRYILEHPAISQQDTVKILNNVNNQLQILNDNLQTLRVIAQFNVSLIVDPTILTQLRANLSDSDIIELLEVRTDVTGISLTADAGPLILKVANQLPGSTAISTLAVNSQVPTDILENQIENLQVQINNVQKALNTAIATPNSFNVSQVIIANNGVPPVSTLTAPASGFTGQASYDSPVSLIASFVNLDTVPTFSLNTNALTTASDPFSFLTVPIAAITLVVQGLKGIIDGAFAAIFGVLTPAIAQLQALQTQVHNLFGSGSFDSSLLKCGVGVGLSPLLGPFNNLLSPLQLMQDAITNLLASVTNAIANVLGNILCKPISILNTMIGNLNSLPLPCKIANFGLPPTVASALAALRGACQARTTILSYYSRNLFELNAAVILGPQNVTNFQVGATCAGDTSLSFLTAGQRAINFGLASVANPFTAPSISNPVHI